MIPISSDGLAKKIGEYVKDNISEKITIEEFAQIIKNKDRNSAGVSVPGKALFLFKVEYPKELYLYVD